MTSSDEQVSVLFFSHLKQKSVRISGGIPRIVSFSIPCGRVTESKASDFRVASGDCSVQLKLDGSIFERGTSGVWSIKFPDVEGGISVEELPG